ncbi:hypothetical protein OAQ99_03035 [Candidatus Kapabacteria bacterium]|nr:hypothetical protein [Candidatus Kapabacteria bacterium]
MFIVSISAISIAVMKQLQFLLLIGLFSSYMIFLGKRSFKIKKSHPKRVDYIISSVATVIGILLIVYSPGYLKIFGILLSIFALTDIKKYKNHKSCNWQNIHIARMIGAYISTVTAFLVVNLSGELNGLLLWLGPSVIGTAVIIYWSRKSVGLPIVILILLSSYQYSPAQVYINGGKTKHRFAQMTLGLESRNIIEPRILIGGTHFWGHADFYLSIPLITKGVETGFKYYPWQIKNNSFSPYLGISANVIESNGKEKFITPLLIGLNYCTGNNLIEIGTSTDYLINLTYKYSFDTTIGVENATKSGYIHNLREHYKKKGKLNSITFGAGFSSVFLTSSDELLSDLYIDLSAGYYLYYQDIQFNLIYRSFELEAKRKFIGIEILKYLFDYNGFAFFSGLNSSYDLQKSLNNIHYGLTFGWDIRPSDVDSFYLRTNVRFSKIQNKQTLEVNFIQLVLFLDRLL